jgi:cytochrome bd ubiquinol oxidase subunit I
MTNLFAARAQMGMSLGFHIIFASIGIAMPAMMVIAEWLARRTGDVRYRELARHWARGVAVLFAVGAVSGTVLSFELGLLWPHFMQYAGAIIGIPFSLEGFAFFTEAIFLGLYLYGWDRIPARAHQAAGVIVATSGAASAVFVVMVNAWMNAPAGVTIANGRIVHIDPLAGMQSPAAFAQALHMLLAAYASTGLAVAGVHALMLLRRSSSVFHRHALAVALFVGVPAAILQPFAGDLEARVVARTQPVKLAALEGQFATQPEAPLRIGGVPDVATQRTRHAIEIPGGLSLVAFGDRHATVQGLTAFPRQDWPPVLPVHLAFQIMVALGLAMALVSVWCIGVAWRRREIASHRALLRALLIVSPFGFIATEAGWVVTEVGRQPWIVQGLLRTADAVTPMPGLTVPFTVFTLLYIGLAAVVILLIRGQVRDTSAT